MTVRVPAVRATIASGARAGMLVRVGEGSGRVKGVSRVVLKAISCGLLPRGMTYLERFRLAAEAGFTHVEMATTADPSEADEVGAAARATGVCIHAVVASSRGLTVALHGVAEQVETAIDVVVAAIENAVLWSADTVLIASGPVDAVTSYEAAYADSQRVIRERLLPLAEAHRVTLGIENVWYGFLLSPIDYVRYIDELASPWVRGYLDVGNMIFGHPHHWVRAAGPRIAQIHLKDFWMGFAGGRSFFARPGEGGVDWLAVRRALREIGYTGCVTTSGVPFSPRIVHLDRIRDGLEYRGLGFGAVLRPLDLLRRRAFASFLGDLSRRVDRFDRME